MFQVHGHDGAAPTRLLSQYLGDWQPAHDGPSYADLTLEPEPQHSYTRECWYRVHYTHETVVTEEAWVDGEWVEFEVLDHHRIELAATLPAPPVIPVEEHLAALPEPTLDGWTEDEIRVWGGREGVLALVRSRQEIGVRDDRTVAVFDWAQAAENYRSVLDAIEPRKLTVDERVHVGRARVLKAKTELANARKGLEALRANAERAQS